MAEKFTMTASVKVSEYQMFEEHMAETYGAGNYTLELKPFARQLLEQYYDLPEKFSESRVTPQVHFFNGEMATFFKLTHGSKMVFDPDTEV